MANNLDIILDEAFSAFNTGLFERAETLCRQVLSAQNTNGDALFLLGLIAYQSNALEPAEELLFQAVKLYPNIENYTLTLTSVLYRQGRLDEALKYYQKFPNNPLGLSEQGYIYLQKNKSDESKQLFEKALLIQKDLPQARLGLALLNSDIDNISDIAHQSNLSDAWYYLSKFYFQEKDFEKALKTIEKADVQDEKCMLQKALILENLNKTQEAVVLYREITSKNPYNPDAWNNQANIFKKNKEYAAAEDYYKRALAQDKDYLPARHNLADLLYQRGRLAEALEQYRYIFAKDTKNIPALYNLAIILEKTGEFAEALGIYFKLLSLGNFPDELEWRIVESLSILYKTNKNLAVDFAKGWIKNFPNNPIAEHCYAALTNKKEDDISDYISKFYNSFSDSYDDKMQKLQNMAISETLNLIPNKKYKKSMDLGCGTGAWGRAFKSHIQHLTGIDLSEKMLEKAKESHVYDKLLNQEVVSFLRGAHEQYDLITGIGVLEYIPNITDLFQQIPNNLVNDGLFVFSIEITNESKPILAPHGRYLYPINYVENLLQEHGLKVLNKKEINLRLEDRDYAKGYIIISQKNLNG